MSHEALVAESEALHGRVRAFARDESGTREAFDSLALDIARYQERHVPGFRRLVAASGASLSGATSSDVIPAVPVDAFRLARVAVLPAELDEVRFETSGTTADARGTHVMRTTATYRELSVRWAARALLGSADPRVRPLVIALASRPAAVPASSLAFMMRELMSAFDGRALPGEATFDARSPARWLATSDGVDVEGLRRAAAHAGNLGAPLLVLATGFALVLLLDALAGGRVEVPPGSVVMPTGGVKGRTREVPAEELASGVARAFGLTRERIVGEYGMTELTSQLYEGTLPGGCIRAPAGVFVPPPWLRVQAVDPISLAPVPEGEPGLARFVDLGNVDSAVAVVTQDRILREGPGVRLLGRAPGSPPRGCSLALEALVVGRAAAR